MIPSTRKVEARSRRPSSTVHVTCIHYCIPSAGVAANNKVRRAQWVCFVADSFVCEVASIGQDGERSQRDRTVLQGFVRHFEHHLHGELAAPQGGKNGRSCTRRLLLTFLNTNLAIKQTTVLSPWLSLPAHRPSHPGCRNIPASGGEQLCFPHWQHVCDGSGTADHLRRRHRGRHRARRVGRHRAMEAPPGHCKY